MEGLIKQLWEVEFSAWEHRNSVLHDTPLAEILSEESCPWIDH